MKNKKSFLFKAGTIIILLAIAVIMMIVGRGHTVYLDNKAIDYDGKTYESPYKVVVNVGGTKVAKLYDNERGMATCIGQRFTMDLEITQKKGGDKVNSTYTINLPYSMDGIVIDLPAFLAGLPENVYLSQFVSAVAAEETQEEVVTDEFGLTGANQ